MSNRALTWAFDLELDTTAKFVLVVLADRADQDGSCYPGQETIARATGLSVRAVRSAIDRLIEAHVLTKEQRRRRDGYRGSDRYYLAVGADPTEPESHRHDVPVTESTSPAPDDNLTGTSRQSHRHDVPVASREPSDEPSVEPPVIARKRATRIPEPFILTGDMKAEAAVEWPGLDVFEHTKRFVDYWRGKAGKDGTKLDWMATWRNWMRRANDDEKNRRSAPGYRESPADRARRIEAELAARQQDQRKELIR